MIVKCTNGHEHDDSHGWGKFRKRRPGEVCGVSTYYDRMTGNEYCGAKCHLYRNDDGSEPKFYFGWLTSKSRVHLVLVDDDAPAGTIMHGLCGRRVLNGNGEELTAADAQYRMVNGSETCENCMRVFQAVYGRPWAEVLAAHGYKFEEGVGSG